MEIWSSQVRVHVPENRARDVPPVIARCRHIHVDDPDAGIVEVVLPSLSAVEQVALDNAMQI